MSTVRKLLREGSSGMNVGGMRMISADVLNAFESISQNGRVKTSATMVNRV